jgi:hypothetical protein
MKGGKHVRTTLRAVSDFLLKYRRFVAVLITLVVLDRGATYLVPRFFPKPKVCKIPRTDVERFISSVFQ